MTMNPFKFVLSDKFYMRYDYSNMMLSILSFSERGAVCSLIQSERIINDYDWERDYDYLMTHKPIDGVFKKPAVSKDKISLELPKGKSEFIFEGKVLKKQKTDVSKWEQKFNQISKIVNSPDPDSAVVIFDFDKFYEIIRGLKGKLGKDNLIIFTIKKSGKGRDQLSTFAINNTLLMEHGIESPFLVFDSEKTDEINVYLDYGIVYRVLKLIIDNNHNGTKGNIRIEFSEKKPVVFDWGASIVVAQKRLTPDEIKSIKTQNNDKMTAKKTAGTRTKGLHQTGTQTLEGRKMDLKIKAELPGKRTSATGKTYYEYRRNRTDMPNEREDFDKIIGENVKRWIKPKKQTKEEQLKSELKFTKLHLDESKQELRNCYDSIKGIEENITKQKKKGLKREAQYGEVLIKENKAEILKLEKKVIPDLEKKLSELEAKTSKKTPAKKTSTKKTSSGTSASKVPAKKKTVKSRKTRKTSKTQKTLF